MLGEATTPMPDQRVVCGCREPAPDLGPAELTAEEARAEVDRLSLDLYRAGDALLFAREMCDHAEDGGLAEVPIARVREWLEGAKCGRAIMAERGRSITEFVQQADAPTELGTPAPSPNETGGGVGTSHSCPSCDQPEAIVPSTETVRGGRRLYRPAPSAGRDTMREAIAGGGCDSCETCELATELATERTRTQQAGIRIAELTALVAAQQQVIERLAREALAAIAVPYTPRARTAPVGPDGRGDGGGK